MTTKLLLLLEQPQTNRDKLKSEMSRVVKTLGSTSPGEILGANIKKIVQTELDEYKLFLSVIDKMALNEPISDADKKRFVAFIIHTALMTISPIGWSTLTNFAINRLLSIGTWRLLTSNLAKIDDSQLAMFNKTGDGLQILKDQIAKLLDFVNKDGGGPKPPTGGILSRVFPRKTATVAETKNVKLRVPKCRK